MSLLHDPELWAADQRGESAADAVSVVFLEAWRRRQDVVLEGVQQLSFRRDDQLADPTSVAGRGHRLQDADPAGGRERAQGIRAGRVLRADLAGGAQVWITETGTVHTDLLGYARALKLVAPDDPRVTPDAGTAQIFPSGQP